MRSCLCKAGRLGLLTTPYQQQKTSSGLATEAEPPSTGITPGLSPTSETTFNPIPCYGGTFSGCTAFASAPAAIQTACTTAATAPYGGSGTQLGQLALASLANFGCYAQGDGVLTPPAYGTTGNASKGFFIGPVYYNVDFSVAKLWKVKERYTAQFRVEFFNFFNRVDLTPTPTSVTPSSWIQRPIRLFLHYAGHW